MGNPQDGEEMVREDVEMGREQEGMRETREPETRPAEAMSEPTARNRDPPWTRRNRWAKRVDENPVDEAPTGAAGPDEEEERPKFYNCNYNYNYINVGPPADAQTGVGDAIQKLITYGAIVYLGYRVMCEMNWLFEAFVLPGFGEAALEDDPSTEEATEEEGELHDEAHLLSTLPQVVDMVKAALAVLTVLRMMISRVSAKS